MIKIDFSRRFRVFIADKAAYETLKVLALADEASLGDENAGGIQSNPVLWLGDNIESVGYPTAGPFMKAYITNMSDVDKIFYIKQYDFSKQKLEP